MENTIQLHDKKFRIMIPAEQIDKAVDAVAQRINADYAGKETPLFLGILNGSFMFMSDLIKKIEFQNELSFVKLASYDGTCSTGCVKSLIGLNNPIEGRHVIIVEDIVDTGESIEHMIKELEARNPASVEVCTLFFKPGSYRKTLPIKYRAMEIGNEFIVGLRAGLRPAGPQSQGYLRSDGVMAAATDPAWLDGGRMLPLVEDFYTIQGEGFHAGKPAYFIRLGGCDVGCRWCDAKYTWNPKLYPPTDVQTVIDRATSCPAQAIVITGGEPLLYPLGVLTETLRERGLQIFLETSGSHPFSGVFDWVCLSPKRRQPPLDEAFERADELKVIVESEEDFEWAERNAARVGGKCLLFLQPEWSVAERVMPAIVEYAKAHPQWNISIQTHKYMHIP